MDWEGRIPASQAQYTAQRDLVGLVLLAAPYFALVCMGFLPSLSVIHLAASAYRQDKVTRDSG